MHMLRIFCLRRTEEQETCHAKFRYDISEFVLFLKPECDALSVSLHPFQARTEIPRERRKTFANNIRPPNPTVFELRTEEMSPYLLGNDFSFRQFGHERNPCNAVVPN